eukprot:GFUD01000907.1.p1 GENE.GFUD01000907.1~~GFUD01000907.1.p1  ORF type:complete len:3255 (-),score=789.69 GFUD01000907.1:272-10036(-)
MLGDRVSKALMALLPNKAGSQESVKEAAKAELQSQSDVRDALERANLTLPKPKPGVISNNTTRSRHVSDPRPSKPTPATKRLSYKKNKTSSGSSRNQSDIGSKPGTPFSETINMEKSKILTEKRPSITEKELTPIVLNQLQSTKKHKDELRKARRGSHPKTELQPPEKSAATDIVSDSGAESCSEEARIKTAEAFMTGIHSALSASIPDLNGRVSEGQGKEVEGASEDIVTEVENVLGKLMASLQRGETALPGLGLSSQNIIPLITNLQATLKANVESGSPVRSQSGQIKESPAPPSSLRLNIPQPTLTINESNPTTPLTPRTPNSSVKEWKTDPLGSLPKPPVAENVKQIFDEPLQARTFDPTKSKAKTNNGLDDLPQLYTELENSTHESKIAWKIRANRKRQQKHLTLGLTREEFANIQESLKHRPVEFTGLRPAPYSLMRNKSEGQILKKRHTVDQDILFPDYPQFLANSELFQDSPEELGYVSDVCDYNVRYGSDLMSKKIDAFPKSGKNKPDTESKEEAGVIHGKLSLSIAPEESTIKVDQSTRIFQKDDSYVHSHARNSPVKSAVSDVEQVERISPSEPSMSSDNTSSVTNANANVYNIVKPFPSKTNKKPSEDEQDSQLSRQSSVEDNKIDSKTKRKSSGGKSSAIKTKIQMRKMMKEANKLEIPTGILSDPDPDNEHDQDSVEEKQDSEPILDDESTNPNKKFSNLFGPGVQNLNMSQLTPETARRMKDWNSRFSNLKHSFDPTSDKEDDPSRSPSMQRHTVESSDGEDRGRSRFKDKSMLGPRSKSAHSNLHNSYSKSTQPQIVVDNSSTSAYPQSKDDKNKNNTIIAKRASSMTENIPTPKEKSPSIRRVDDTDDEYMQYLNSVDRYRQSNPNPKPFRPVTARTDAIANPLRKMSDGQGQAPGPGPAAAPVRQQSFSFTPQAKSKQTTPVRDNSEVGARISRSVPKEVTKQTQQTLKEETQAEILGLVKTNKETGQVEKTNDMDYEDYMNIINKVRKTKEHTRVRTEQARLASMYAQELKRQEEIKLEEQRLKLERQRFEEEKRSANNLPIITTVSSLLSQTRPKNDYNMEKGQLDNIEQEQSKISPSTSTTTVLPKQTPITHAQQSFNSTTEKSQNNNNNNSGVVNQNQEALNNEKQLEEQKKREEKLQKEREKEEMRMLEAIQNEQIQQQKIREEQVLAEQKKLEKLKEEQIKQEKEREEIRQLEIERLRQIQEDQERLEFERRIQEEQIRFEQMRLEEERRRQEELQSERQAQYLKQEEEMEAKARAMEEQKRLETERLKMEQINRQNSMSPREKMIFDKMRYQERLREEQLKEEAQIRQEKLNLIRQEEMLLVRQDEMLKQIQDEKVKLLKQEEMIRNRQQDRLKQVRSEKALLEKQEQMLKLREEQLVHEHRRQEKLREEAVKLKKQEEEIRRRQEEIAKELMQSDITVPSVDDVMVCQAREGQVFVGRKPHYPETVLDSSIVHVQQLNTSDWSSSDAESINPNSASKDTALRKSLSTASAKSTYMGANENYDSSSPFVTVNETVEIIEPEEEEQWSGSSEEEDTMEEELYECKVEVKQQTTMVPTSVRTIESVVDVPGWAPVTPYLNVSKNLPTTTAEEISAIFSEAKNSNMQYITAGVITSPESVLTSTNMITTPDSSISLQSQMSMNDDHELSSSWPGSPIPPVPPPPKDSQDLMREQFQTVQPDVPPRDDSFAITAVYSSGGTSTKSEKTIDTQATKRRSLIEIDNMLVPRSAGNDPQLSPRLGGPGSAFKPYASSENLYDPSLFPSQRPPLSNGHHGNGDRSSKRYSTSSLKPPKISESDEDFFKPKASPKAQRAQIPATTTDTEPEMKEFNLGPIGGDKKTNKKQQKAIYSTSETEEEYQAYLKIKPKWHGKGGHKDSWDPLQIASPPQIVQRPVGVVQKPKPQAKIPEKIERGAQVYPVSLQIYPGGNSNGQIGQHGQLQTIPVINGNHMLTGNNGIPDSLISSNFERIQKSDSIIELREKQNLLPAYERIQKSNSVVEVVPTRKISVHGQPPQVIKESSPFIAPTLQTFKESSPYLQQNFQSIKESSPYIQTSQPVNKESSPYIQTSPPVIKEASPFMPKSPQAMKEPSPLSVPNSISYYSMSPKERNQVHSMPTSMSLPMQLDSLAQSNTKVNETLRGTRTDNHSNGDTLLLPMSPQDSEDQTTPQAPRKLYMPKQTSVESTTSFSENDEMNENQAPMLRSIKEDPETTKKKEIHKNLMSEALKKVELRNNQKKNFSQLARTNPTLASLDIVTRKELKMEEMEAKMEQEDLNRSRHKSGSETQDEPMNVTQTTTVNSAVNPSVLQTFREQSIHKGQSGQNGASRQAAIAAKKAGTPKKASTPVKPEIMPKPGDSRSEQQNIEPVVVLRKQPRILEPDELKARQTADHQKGTLPLGGKSTPGIEANMPQTGVRSDPRSAMNNVSSVQEAKEIAEVNQPITPMMTHSQKETSSTGQKHLESSNASKEKDTPVSKRAMDQAFTNEGKQPSTRAPSTKEKEELAAKALEKINAAQKVLKQQKVDQKAVPAKQNLEGLVHVKPKQPEIQRKSDAALDNIKRVTSTKESSSVKNSDNLTPPETKKTSITKEENITKVATVRRAAEKFEMNLSEMNTKSLSESTSALNFNSNLRGRSKSIGDALREQFVEDQDSKNILKTSLPWTGKSPSAIRRRDATRNKGYALQTSKSCDSITAAKLLAKARAENSQMAGGLRINQNFSKSIEQQIDVYSKTKDEIRKILNLAKVGSVTDRVSLFTNMKHKEPPQVDPDEKAKAIRQEIEEARARAQETVSDTEIEFQAPIESKVKPLKIPMKPKIMNSPEKRAPSSPGTGLRINQSAALDSPKRERRLSIEDLPSVRSKIQTYISAAEDTNKEEETKELIAPKPILKNNQDPTLTPNMNSREKERSRSPRKKTPKLVSDHYLAPDQSLQIYTQSATDVSATEDEAEHSKISRPSRKKPFPMQISSQEPGPTFLKVPPKSASESRPGIIKSKSFATPGQFECSIDDSAGKKQQMMSFFGHGNKLEGQQKMVRIREKPIRRSSITSITDEIVAEDDLVDIDAEFESLLNSTFEKESRKLMTSETQNINEQRQFEKAKSAVSQRGKRSSVGPGGRGVSLDMSSDSRYASMHPGKNSRLQKSQSFGCNTPSSISSSIVTRSVKKEHNRSRSSSVDRVTPTEAMYQNSPVLRQKNFDPIAALPTSHTKQYHKNFVGTPPPHSPSPTQSEYDTCDPWDDY